MHAHLRSIVNTFQNYLRTYTKPIALFIAAVAMICGMAMVVPMHPTYDSYNVDIAWELDLMNKLEQGEISGRDFMFTYGPGAQLAYATSKFIRPNATVFDRIAVSYWFIRIIVVVLLLSCIYTIPKLNWQSSLFIFICFALLINWPTFLRVFVALQAILLFARALSLNDARKRDIYCVVVALICFAGQLFTFDVGIFTLLGVCGTLAVCGLIWLLRSRISILPDIEFKTLFRSGAIFGGAYLALNLLTCLLFSLTSSNYKFFDYIYYNLQIVSSYNYTMGAQWNIERLFSLTLLCVFLYCVIAFIKNYSEIPLERRYIYIALFVLSIAQFKGAMVRSETTKVLLSSSPLIFLFLLLAFDEIKSKTFALYARILLILLVFLWPTQVGIIGLNGIVASIKNPEIFANQIHSIRWFSMPPETVVPAGIAEALEPDTYMLNFPYENMFAIALERKSLTPVLQSYAAHNFKLQEYYINRIEAVRDKTEIVYSLDGITAGEIDIMQHITRLPHIFEYIYSHFELKYDKLFNGGYVVLQPRAEAVSIPTTPIEFTTTYHSDGSLTASFVEPVSCSALKLSLEMSYPVVALIGRPTPLQVQALFEGNELVSRRLPAIERDQEFSTYLYPGDPRLFYKIFTPDQPQGFAYRIDSLELDHVNLGLFDVHPDMIELNKLECVNLTPGTVENVQPDRETIIGVVVAEAPIRQEFIAEKNNLNGIYLELSTFSRPNEGTISFRLQHIDQSGTEVTVAESIYDMDSFIDNTRFLFSFPSQTISEGQKYILVVDAPEGTLENSITLWMKEGNPYTAGNLLRGGEVLDGDLFMQLLYAE
jgi:hypothetical protein